MTNDKQYPDPPVALRHIYKFTDPLSGEPIWRPEVTSWNGRAAQAAIGLYTLAQMKEFADATCAMRAAQAEPAAVAGPNDLAQLRHLYANLVNGGVRSADSAKRIAVGLVGPVIERLEKASAIQPSMQHATFELATQPQEAATSQDAEDAARYRWLAAYCRSTSEHWGGRWSIVIDGPAPKSHDSEDYFDAAIDAAMKKGGAA